MFSPPKKWGIYHGSLTIFPIQSGQDEEYRGFNTVSVGIGSISSLDVPEMPEAAPALEMEDGYPLRSGGLIGIHSRNDGLNMNSKNKFGHPQ